MSNSDFGGARNPSAWRGYGRSLPTTWPTPFADSAERNAKLIAETAITYFLDNYDAFIFMELVEKDPQISEEALEAARGEYAQLSTIIQRWLDEGELKEIDLELIQGIVWSISAVIVKYLKANNIKEVDEIFLDIIWEAIKK